MKERTPRIRYLCLEKGDVFRTLNLPNDFIIGLDTMAMTTNKSLSGFRDIPPGAHFLWVQQPGGVSRCGYWFVTGTSGRLRVKQWERYNEVLGEAGNANVDLEALYPTLQPYDLGRQETITSHPLLTPSKDMRPDWAQSPLLLWRTLTSAISTKFIAKLTGKADTNEYFVDSMDSAPGSNNELLFLFTQDLGDLQLLDRGPLHSRVSDTSPRILTLLEKSNDSNRNIITEQDILAELQFTFLTGTNLNNPSCIEYWWSLVLKIVLRAYTLPLSRPTLARDIVQTLYAQLLFAEEHVGSSSQELEQTQSGQGIGGGIRDGPSSESVVFQFEPRKKMRLRSALVEYKRRLGETLEGLGEKITAEQRAVGRAFEELESWLWRCGWDLRGEGKTEDKYGKEDGDGDVDVGDSEDEDDQPMVVELDEEGREVGLVSFRD